MMPNLKQFVPSDVCLQCDGCCRFKEAESAWRPRISPEEIARAQALPLADRIFSHDAVDEKQLIRTKPGCGEHLCSFFNAQDHTCAIYRARPFECELYPFVISCDSQGAAVYVHLNCPYVEEHHGPHPDYVRYLQDYFRRPEVLDYLRAHRSLLNDYSAYKQELRLLFAIDDLNG